MAAGRSGFQLRFQVRHVIVPVAKSLSLTQTDAIDDAGMIELIRNDGILICQQSFEESTIRIETGAVQDCVFGSEEFAELCFQMTMDGLSPADETHGCHPIAPAIEPLMSSFQDSPMIRQTKVVVGTEIQNTGSDSAAVCRHSAANQWFAQPCTKPCSRMEFSSDFDSFEKR